MIKRVWILFQQYCWGIGGLLTLCMFTKAWGFVPAVPSVIIWALLMYIILRNIQNGVVSALGLWFLALIPWGIVFFEPDPCFKSWQRYGNFAMLFLAIGPVFQSKYVNRVRIQAISMFALLSIFTGVVSFFCYFMKINYMRIMEEQELMRNTAGYFGGLCNHSMTLGIIAAAGVTCSIYMYILGKKYVSLFFFICCFGATLFAASRSALFAAFAGIMGVAWYISKRRFKMVGRLVAVSLIAIVTFPLWQKATDLIVAKQRVNEEQGSATASRDSKFAYRIQEFQESPLFGVGICAIDPKIGDEYSPLSGQVEPGSSWLQIPSMTGVVGTIPFLMIVFGAFKNTKLKKDVYQRGLLMGLLLMFYMHFIAEGYLLSAGNEMCYLAWLVIATCMMPWDRYIKMNGKLFLIDENLAKNESSFFFRYTK